uniref:MATH domain-containing protein n=1 Tax=Leersia perrieri TaxID=77586 RepID=A0A0D9XUD2_9ORYZ
MSTSKFLAATCTSSRMVASTVSAFHILHIDNYSLTKSILPGAYISSGKFLAGSKQWWINFYPNVITNTVDDEVTSDTIAFYLNHGASIMPSVQARYRFSILDGYGRPRLELPRRMGVFGRGADGCYGEFIWREDLERRRGELLVGDRLNVRSSGGQILRTASSIICRQVTGSHILRIDGYSHLRRLITNGDHVAS